MVLVTTAAEDLTDRDAIVGPLRDALVGAGAAVVELDLAKVGATAVEHEVQRADAVLVGGGDPYHLLDAAQRSRFGPAVAALLDRGGVYCGISAGAMAVGPSLEPLRMFSPFPEPPAGTDLAGLGLVDVLVLPHDDRTGRRELHGAALRAHGREHDMIALRDDEHLVIDRGARRLYARDDLHLRAGRGDDASAVTQLFVDAGRIGWASFLSPDQLEGIVPDTATWTKRLTAAGTSDEHGEVVVAVDDAGVAGFIWVRQASELDLTEPAGEVATFYTDPRVWGAGVGRRLMDFGLDRLRSMGYHECVLWTHERNERPLRIYAETGWTLDGQHRTRDFHGLPITELRHRYQL